MLGIGISKFLRLSNGIAREGNFEGGVSRTSRPAMLYNFRSGNSQVAIAPTVAVLELD